MTFESEKNPCCKKKGTLVITIEPCTKGKQTKPDKTTFHTGERYIPGLPHKTARTMEIEVKIKGKDPELISEEEVFSNDGTSEENAEETELITHFPSMERKETLRSDKYSQQEESSDKSLPKAYSSCRTIMLERKTCSETCPGPLICRPKKHFLGDKCKLHDPTPIGQQILEMHKKGLIRKRPYVSERIYPDHILHAISEIHKMQTKPTVKDQKDDSSKKMSSVESDEVDLKEIHVRKEHHEEKVHQTPVPVPVPVSAPVEKEHVKRNRSGCYC